jgi:hypothetical protein
LLVDAMDAYLLTFGHRVPVEVTELFAMRPGPLLVEIRQAIALRRAVPAWEKQGQLARTSPERWHELQSSSTGGLGAVRG